MSMQKAPVEKLKIRWAFDPYDDNKHSWEQTLKILAGIQTGAESEVIPTYVLGKDLVHWISNVTPSQVVRLKPIVEKVMNSSLEGLGEQNLAQPEILVSNGESKRKDAEFAAHFFAEDKSDLIVLNTHARSGFDRLFMGSFAENLMLQSEVPILFIPPKVDMNTELKKTFYPTDLSSEGLPAFIDFLENSVHWGGELVLYSKIISPISAFAESASYALGGGWVSFDSFMTEALGEKRKQANKWAEMAQKHGFTTEVVIDEAPGDFLKGLMAALASSGADLIAMSSSVSASETLFVGSTAREIVRNSPVPVLVKHYKREN